MFTHTTLQKGEFALLSSRDSTRTGLYGTAQTVRCSKVLFRGEIPQLMAQWPEGTKFAFTPMPHSTEKDPFWKATVALEVWKP